MIPIVQEKRKPTFAEKLNVGVGRGLEGVSQLYQQKKQDEAIKQLTGKDLSGLSPEMKKIFVESLAKTPGHEMIVSALKKRGVSEDDANLYAHLSVGGQTAFVKDMLEAQKREKKFPNNRPNSDLSGQEEDEVPQRKLSPEQQANQELDQELETQDEGLTPKERVARQKERFDTGLKRYEEAGTKLRGLARDKERLDIINKINDSDNLPKNLGRINVKSDGNLRAPFLASPEAQQFVKTLNEFSAGAKDTYGSRVTNFDLQQYMLRYPNLLNSSEGRKRVIQQMKIVNQINSAYYKNLKNVYDKAGGVRKIDADTAERFAEKLSDPKINELVKKFDEIGRFPTLPNAQEAKGKTVVNHKTGEVLKSNGEEWLPVGR